MAPAADRYGDADPARTARLALLQSAVRLEQFTIAWTVFEAIAAVGLGVIARSIALIAFGLDSAIETFAAVVVYHQLRLEARDGSRAAERETRALRLVGGTFLVLAAYVAYEAVSDLVKRAAPEPSVPGMVLSAWALLVMLVLGQRKARVGRRLGSRTLIADSIETYVCAYLSAAVLAGVALNATLGWWWADPLAAFTIVPVLVHEGREAFEKWWPLDGI